jgi:predicted nucleotidyltransferase
MTVQAIIHQTASIIRENLSGEYKILLFGSQAKGNALATSDVDIAISGNEKIAPRVIAKIRDEVDTLRTLRKVDVLDLTVVDEEYRRNILSYAKEIQE